ncbi:MAG: DUF1738 domain-containing protein [Alphaproteobacteria bacterium]|nr:MAG: DUF1738 domain-containing protein [Alphaproteobacteria bacterium]
MRNLFQQVTDEILAAIESGTEDFSMPWHASGLGLPSNAISGRAYRGVNTLLLWARARSCAYRSARWATYRQWAAAGAQVRKGETSTTVLFWKGVANEEGDSTSAADCGNRPRFIARAFRVFNADQLDGADEPTIAQLGDDQRIQAVDQFFARLPATIWHGGDCAFYDVRADLVSMPGFGSFRRPEGFYSTLAHELVHWSGANHRLGRDLKNRFGTEAYAMEELIAELGAAFLGAQLGLAVEPRRDHAPYIASWLKVLRDDPRAIVTAASKAQIAVNYILELAGTAEPAVFDSAEHAA